MKTYVCGKCTAQYEVADLAFCNQCMEFNTILPQATRHRIWQGEEVVEASQVYKSPVTTNLSPYDISVGSSGVVTFFGPPPDLERVRGRRRLPTSSRVRFSTAQLRRG